MNPAILIVDDEQSICAAVKRTLKKEKFDVLTANSGAEALQLLNNRDIDVIISDQNMPGMKGTELLTIVKNNMPSIGRIMLSGQSDQEDLTKAINEANINFFIPKPWNNDQLIKKVKENIYLHQEAKTNSKTKVVPFHRTAEKQQIEAFNFKNHSTDTYNQISLEQAIKNNRLLVSTVTYQHDSQSPPLSTYRIDWPEISRFKHQGITHMADNAGFLHDLFTWYLTEVEATPETENPVLLDIFFDAFLMNTKLYSYLVRLLEKRNNLILRTTINTVQQQNFIKLLPTLYRNNHSLALNIGNNVINVTDLHSTPISHIEMDNSFHSINNSYLTEKRLIMNKEAENIGIKTILSSNNAIYIPNYPLAMNFNYYEID